LNYVRMPNAIQRDRFVLKVLNQRLFELRVRGSLKRGVERLDDHEWFYPALIERKKDLGIASAAKAAVYQVTIVDYAVFQSKLRHRLVSKD